MKFQMEVCDEKCPFETILKRIRDYALFSSVNGEDLDIVIKFFHRIDKGKKVNIHKDADTVKQKLTYSVEAHCEDESFFNFLKDYENFEI